MVHLGAPGFWGLPLADIGAGFGGAVYSFGDVDASTATGTGAPTVEKDSHLWGFAGIPFRVSGFLTRNLALRLEYDLNFMSLMGAELGGVGGSVMRAGLELHLRRLLVSATVTGGSFSPDNLTYTGGVAVVF